MTIVSKLAGKTTGIGSLPHAQIDAALQFSFSMGIPFLPQLPARNPWEFMIPAALEGLPGLQVDRDGIATLDQDVWMGRARALNDRLLSAFESSHRPDAFAGFEPTGATSACWQPFLWEVGERKLPAAKIQLVGPLTAQWSLRAKNGRPLESDHELATQIFRLILARATAMVRRLKATGAHPILFLDEPGLFSLTLPQATHASALAELRLAVQALKKEGATVGLHCCSNTDWKTVLGLGLDLVSIDVALSLQELLGAKTELERYLDHGSRLSLGVVPAPRAGDGWDHVAKLRQALSRHVSESGLTEKHRRMILGESLWTPACGLAFHTVEEAETTLGVLLQFAGH